MEEEAGWLLLWETKNEWIFFGSVVILLVVEWEWVTVSGTVERFQLWSTVWLCEGVWLALSRCQSQSDLHLTRIESSVGLHLHVNLHVICVQLHRSQLEHEAKYLLQPVAHSVLLSSNLVEHAANCASIHGASAKYSAAEVQGHEQL